MIKSIVGFILRILPRPFLQLISKPIFKLISIFYRGKNVECPICNSKFSKFFPYGRDSRDNALCTNCLSLERHRLLYIYLFEKSDLLKKVTNVLHIAPEECFIKIFKKHNKITYNTADLESPLAEIKMDIHDMPFEDDMYDFILCNHVLEHVQDDIKALSEIKRVLKKGGKGIVQVPFYKPIPKYTIEDKNIKSKKDREKYYGQSDHVRKYGEDYKQRLESTGLKVEIVYPSDFLSKSEMKLYSVFETEEIYLINK